MGTAMLGNEQHNENKDQVAGIAYHNQLGPGIKIASIEAGEEGSGTWSTCAMGCQRDPPQDVAHLQFRSRIAFKLVWVPPNFTSFVLVDDDGELLARGSPTGVLPDKRDRVTNFRMVEKSKYSKAALKVSQ